MQVYLKLQNPKIKLLDLCNFHTSCQYGKNMQSINVKEAEIRTLKADDIDYVCITDIARQKNPV